MSIPPSYDSVLKSQVILHFPSTTKCANVHTLLSQFRHDKAKDPIPLAICEHREPWQHGTGKHS